ncbi:MAG: class I SAM-dependent methyltransferase [Pyrinomonadaceae bacterium]|nr:class I SAM-dependent methyltransferase [Acidobacteriota bacterium]MBP7415041.1 class I SAM-dependent methyltransferase [Pyrinomonadaceae bacterium]
MNADLIAAARFDDLAVNYSDLLPGDRSARILDIGCGSGRFLEYLSGLGFTQLTGVDIDEGSIAGVREKLGIRAEVINDVAGFLNEESEKYELIIAKDVIYYFSNETLIPYLKAIRTGLSPGGILIVEVFNGAPMTGSYIKNKDYPINFVFTEHSLRSALQDAGFQVDKLFGTRSIRKGLKRGIFNLGQAIWQSCLKFIYLVERGADEQNPTILTKTLIAAASVPKGSG